ncbi:type V CRISPR-associated protein Cas4 [Candidatus Woesebacteria bacterium]|nr:type V CRISPR-associated protein Cas4 [Candidatus Woesebacteria bacterium]MCB9801680.1 type V CRISPR-associated protein Cas4 [Pseudomonadales bacterium]
MHSYIQLSKLNDFLFCPYSVYLKSIYDGFKSDTYHATPQKRGKIHHKAIDEGTYSSSTRYLQGLSVYSEKYNIAGKIDIYDTEKKALVDRKYKVKAVYDGHRFQLFGQYFCMAERGYEVEKLFLHSLSDNKRYEVALPEGIWLEKFEQLVVRMQNPENYEKDPDVTIEKCQNCIYSVLCPYAKSA